MDVDSFDLITVNTKEYYVYNYIGNLKDMKNISIVISYPKESFHHNKCLKAFISLNSNLSALKILTQYAERWSIELFFKNRKDNLGLNGYQVISERAINRYLLLMLINYAYCSLNSKGTNNFNIGFKLMKNDLKKSKIISIYNSVKNGITLK